MFTLGTDFKINLFAYVASFKPLAEKHKDTLFRYIQDYIHYII
jgi:hypothetical protein